MKLLSIKWHSAMSGFTMRDLLAVVFAMASFAILAASTVAGSRTHADRLVCANNLRQLGIATHIWAGAHDDQAPSRTSMARGGTSDHPGAANAWLHFSWISNELITPSLLACPGDYGTRAARDWTPGPSGFLNPSYRANAVSYFLSLHVDAAEPLSWLAGDRNLESGTYSQGCGLTAVGTTAVGFDRILFGPSPVQWSATNIHLANGNLLLNDGQVHQTDNLALGNNLRDSVWFTTRNHVLMPR